MCNADFFDDITLGVGPSAYAVVSAEVRKAATEKKMDLLGEEITEHLIQKQNITSNIHILFLLPTLGTHTYKLQIGHTSNNIQRYMLV